MRTSPWMSRVGGGVAAAVLCACGGGGASGSGGVSSESVQAQPQPVAAAAALFVEVLGEHHEYQHQLLSAARTAEEGVKAIVYAYVDWVSANPMKARFALYSRSALAKSEMGGELAANSKARLSEVLRWFDPHIANGTLKKLPKECYSSLITGPSHDYARLWLSRRVKSDIKSHREIFAEAAWNSVKA